MKTYSSKIIANFLLICLTVFSATAQDNFEQIFRAGARDANVYLQNYTEVAGLSFNSGLGSGWYNTAKPHKTLGFDLTFSASLASIPSNEILFPFVESDYDNLTRLSGDTQLPTLVGGSDNSARLRIPAGTTIEDPNNPGSFVTYDTPIDFDSPEGLIDANDFVIVGAPVPALQFGIGIVKNTELKIRYASDFGAIEDGKLNLFGIGVLHDLKQWIPGLKQMPFDLSGFFGYTSLNIEYTLDDITDDGFAFRNPSSEFRANSTTIQVVASKKIAVLTPYVGIGYNIASSSLKVNGEVEYSDNNNTIRINDPVDLTFDGGSTARINAGLRIKLLILTLHAEYAIQKYNTLTLGVGISVR